MPTVISSFNALAGAGRAAVSEVPDRARRGSERRRETDSLRRTPEGGRGRADLLDELNALLQLVGGNLTLYVDAVGDCFSQAATRDNAFNTTGLACAVRPMVEVAAQMAWLLDKDATALERARRSLIWRLDDLARARRNFRLDGEGVDVQLLSGESALEFFRNSERELSDAASAAGWEVRPSSYKKGRLRPSYLAPLEHEQVTMPRYSALAATVIDPFLYTLLSMTSHGVLHGLQAGLETTGRRSLRGSGEVINVRGVGIDPGVAVRITALVGLRGWRRLLEWNGLASTALDNAISTLAATQFPGDPLNPIAD